VLLRVIGTAWLRTSEVPRCSPAALPTPAPAGLQVLEEQWRMRPQISQLIRATIYPSLRDHARVSAYPHVPGMLRDVFFLDHDHPEGGAEEGSSKRNEWEARFVVALARHLTLQVGRGRRTGGRVGGGREQRLSVLPSC
jgi:hypothetical protein